MATLQEVRDAMDEEFVERTPTTLEEVRLATEQEHEGQLFRVRPEERFENAEIRLSPLQTFAQERLGVEPVPLLEPPTSVRPRLEPPPEIRQPQQIMQDIRALRRFQLGFDETLEGNIPFKQEALRRFDKPKEPEALGPLVPRVPRSAIEDVGELALGFGLILFHGPRLALETLATAGGYTPDTIRIYIPDPETGEINPLRVLFNPNLLDEDLKRELVAMGAVFENPAVQTSVIDEIADSEAERLGLVRPEDLPEDATSFGVPFTERRFYPRKFVAETLKRPVSRLLDVAFLGQGVSLGLRAGARSSFEVARLSGLAGKTGVRGAAATERALVRTSLALENAAEKTTVSNVTRLLTRKGLSLTKPTREFLDRFDAFVAAKRLINESDNMSFAQRRIAEAEIKQAFSKLTDEERKLIPALVEGRASLLPGAKTPQMEHSLNVVKRQIRLRQEELIAAGTLQPQTAADRAFAPLAVVKTGKRVPVRGWDEARVLRENQKIAKHNANLALEDRLPSFMTPHEFERTLGSVRNEFTAMVENYTTLPADDLLPLYFPRFPEPQSLREIAREFFIADPTRKRGRLPIERQFTGMSILKGADIRDVERAVLRHNGQVRRVVDTAKLVEEVKRKFAKPLRVDRTGRPIGDDLLPDHVIFNPDGFLVFFRKQLDMADGVAKALDRMGDIESAVADGVRTAFPQGFSRSFVSVGRRTRVYQIPRAAANELGRHVAPVTPLVRLFWDKPLDAWRSAVLAFTPRWHVNNFIGGMTLGVVAGESPLKLVRPLTKAERAALPNTLARQSLAYAESFKPNLGAAAETTAGKIAQAIANVKPIRIPSAQVAKVRDLSFAVNAAVDNHFRSVVYLGLAKKEARLQLMKETGRALISGREILSRAQQFTTNVEAQRRLMSKLDRVFVNFNNLTRFERRFMRRLFPFWTWYREMTRLAVTLPLNSPVRANAIRVASELGQQAEDLEFRQHVGISKKDLPEYLRAQIFVGFDNDSNIVFFSPSGLNIFYGVGQDPIAQIHPGIKTAIEQRTGGRAIGYWGSYVPFRFLKESGVGRLEEGEVVRRTIPSAKTILLQLARQFPQFTLAESLAQQATEGRVTRRFEDVSPLSNIPRQLRGEPTQETAVLQPSREFEPKAPRTLGEVGLQFSGAPLRRYRVEEIMEQEIKLRKAAVGTIFQQLYVNDAEFRSLVDQMAREGFNPPAFEGIREFRRTR